MTPSKSRQTIKFKFITEEGKYGYNETRCTHIQLRKDGKLVRFLKHTDELIEILNDTELQLPNDWITAHNINQNERR